MASRVPLSPDLKRARGTIRPSRERKRAKLRAKHAAPVQAADEAAAFAPRDYLGIREQYIADALAGKVVVSKYRRLAILRDLADQERSASASSWPYAWSPPHAIDVCAFDSLTQCPENDDSVWTPLHEEDPQ